MTIQPIGPGAVALTLAASPLPDDRQLLRLARRALRLAGLSPAGGVEVELYRRGDLVLAFARVRPCPPGRAPRLLRRRLHPPT